jgi:hypothetical protein
MTAGIQEATSAPLPLGACRTGKLTEKRATGITAYLEGGGKLENAQLMAAHESPRTTKLYDPHRR